MTPLDWISAELHHLDRRKNGMALATTHRDTNGRFVKGHPGGPGRPRRPVEQEYLATLSNAVTLSVWEQIVQRAVADALQGDARSREWLARYVLGDQTPSLVQLAADEQLGLTAEGDIASFAMQRKVLAGHQQFKLAVIDLLTQHGVPTP